MEGEKGGAEKIPAGPTFEDLLKEHIRLVAAQRNAVGLSASLREAQQVIEVRSRQFQEMKNLVEARTGLHYNEETLALEKQS